MLPRVSDRDLQAATYIVRVPILYVVAVHTQAAQQP
jgi:hypothetical protein